MFPADPDTTVATLANGVRVLTIRLPHVLTACVSVFVRSGSAHEARAEAGISHVVEHMAFKGTEVRDARRLNLDAERLGADVNAHTDKDHTAFHMRGLARDAATFVRMLGDIVRRPTFPADELEREREVILHEFTEVEEDPTATALALFDRACFGLHPAAQPVIGTRAGIRRLSRASLLDYVRRQYTGRNVIVAAAGAVDPDEIAREAEAAFGSLAPGAENRVERPAYRGGVRTKRLDGSSQVHLALGYPLPAMADDDPAGTMAAAVFGEGMSSPLLEELRERHALAYYCACSADLLAMSGQFVIEASTSAPQLDAALQALAPLLRRHAEAVDAVDVERGFNQLLVKRLRAHEKPARRLEDAALDLLVLGRVRTQAEWEERHRAVGAAGVRTAFQDMLAAGASLAVTGDVARGTREHVRGLLGRRGLALAGAADDAVHDEVAEAQG